MSKNPLFRAMDVVVWVTVFYLARQLPHPYPFAWEGFVGGYVPKQLAYYLISMLWVAGLWFALYRARDRAEAVDHRAVLAGMALMFLVIMTPYATGLLFSSKSRFVYRFFACGAAGGRGGSAWRGQRGARLAHERPAGRPGHNRGGAGHQPHTPPAARGAGGGPGRAVAVRRAVCGTEGRRALRAGS